MLIPVPRKPAPMRWNPGYREFRLTASMEVNLTTTTSPLSNSTHI